MRVAVDTKPSRAERTFPKLMVHKNSANYIVLVDNSMNATVLNSSKGSVYNQGHQFVLSLSQWVDFEGTITLSND